MRSGPWPVVLVGALVALRPYVFIKQVLLMYPKAKKSVHSELNLARFLFCGFEINVRCRALYSAKGGLRILRRRLVLSLPCTSSSLMSREGDTALT